MRFPSVGSRGVAFVQVPLKSVAGQLETTRACVINMDGLVNVAGSTPGLFLALCEVHGGDSDSGIHKLEIALSECRTTNERVTILSPLIRAYEQMGRPEQALESVQALLSLVRAQREEGVSALLSISAPDHAARLVRNHDLDALAVREAVLRARVAERRLVTERLELFERFAVAADLREESSGRHGYRVGRLSALLGERIGCSRDAIAALETAARLHDIGKIAMPDRLLFSPLSLSDGQRRFMTTHTVIGSELLAKSNLPELRLAEEIARHHHECWDGTGYPSKLSGKRIPIHARIVALADGSTR
jgi:putative two-component system response regulator